MGGEHVLAPTRSGYRPPSHRGRAAAITALCHAALLLLLTLAPADPPDPHHVHRTLSVFDLPPPRPERTPPPPPPPPPTVEPPAEMERLSLVAGGSSSPASRPLREEPRAGRVSSRPDIDVLASPTFAFADLPIPTIGLAPALPLGGAIGPDGRGGAGAGLGRGTGTGDGVGPGDGAGPYFLPRWIVPPGPAELGPVTPPVMRGAATAGYGVIACRSRPPGSVRGCRVVGEHPAGSGYGAAARKASPRFRVRPPEIDGKPIAGAWLLIRIDWVYPKPDATVAAR